MRPLLPVRQPSIMTKATPFDEHATEYDSWFDENRALYHAELAAVRDMLPIGGQGVEIGVGTGRFAAPLGIALGVEPSHGMAELARKRGMEVLEGVAEALPLADGAFDFALPEQGHTAMVIGLKEFRDPMKLGLGHLLIQPFIRR